MEIISQYGSWLVWITAAFGFFLWRSELEQMMSQTQWVHP